MGNILTAIENSAINEIEAGGMVFRVRKICSADLAKVGHAALAMAQGLEQPTSKRKSKASKAQDISKEISQQPVEQLQTMAKLKDAIIASGLMAVGDPVSGEWENVEPVLKREDSDPENGRLWVGSLPQEISDSLFTEIMNLSTDGGAALERLRTFRNATRNPVDSRSDSKKIRKTAK
jgi:hypothetical protein